MSNYPRESLTASWVLVNRDGEIVETEHLEDYSSSSTPLDNCLSSPTSLEEERETLEKGTIDLIGVAIDRPISNPEDLSAFALNSVKSEIVCEPDISVKEINGAQSEEDVEELPVDVQAVNANLSGNKSPKSISQYSEESDSQGHTDETDSDLIHLSQDDEDIPGEILELSAGLSTNSSQFSYMNADGMLYDDSPQDEIDSDVLVLDSSHDSLENIKRSLSQDTLFDELRTMDNSGIPERELIDLSLRPKIRQYKHIPNNRLNVALTIIMMLSVTVVLGLAIGHFLGAGRQWIAQTKKAFVLEELRLRNLAEQMPKDSIDFWRKKYKEQLIMNEHLKTVLAMDIQQMNRKKMSRKEQEFHQSKLDMISLQIEHLQILKDLQIILMDLQLKVQEQLNTNATLGENQIEKDNVSLNQKAHSKHSDELIVASDHEDLKNSDERRLSLEASLKNYNAQKTETNPIFYETTFIQQVDSEEKGSLIVAVEDDKIVPEDPQKSYEDEVNLDPQTPIPLLPPPPPENILNEMIKANVEVDPQGKSEEEFSELQQIKLPSNNVDNQEMLVQSLKGRILQLQQENNDLRIEMTHLRFKQLNTHTESREKLQTSAPFHEQLEQNNFKNTESPDKKCTNDNTLFNLSKTLNYYWHQFDKFTSQSINQHLHNLPGSHLFNTDELVKKLNRTKNAFYTLQRNLAQKWMELGSVKNASESFHQKINDPLRKMGNILQQTWNKVKNISQNFFVKEGFTVKKLAKKVSEKLGRIEKTLEKKWTELNEKLNKKIFSHQQRIKEHQNMDNFYHWKVDKKWSKQENIKSRCNRIVGKIKENKIWFNHIQGSRNPYFSTDFQKWLKEEKFFEDDEQEIKEFWKDLKKTMKYPDQKELMWLICQYKWWQPNTKLDVCIDNQNGCKTEKTTESKDGKINTLPLVQEESPNKIFWVFGHAEDKERQHSAPENKKANWFFNRARSRDNLRDRPHPKSEWLFKRAEDRKYQRLFQNEFQDSWKFYDWLNKRAEIRKHLRYLDGFN